MTDEPLLNILGPFFAIPLAGEGLFEPPLFTGLQVVGVTFDLFDDVLLLHLPLKPAQGALQGFSILDVYFSQTLIHPLSLGGCFCPEIG